MGKKINKYTSYSSWWLNSNFSALLGIILFVGLGFLFAFWGLLSAWAIHYSIWLGINNSYKSKKQHRNENTIALYLIFFVSGLFVALFFGWIILLIFWTAGFGFTYWNGKRCNKK